MIKPTPNNLKPPGSIPQILVSFHESHRGRSLSLKDPDQFPRLKNLPLFCRNAHNHSHIDMLLKKFAVGSKAVAFVLLHQGRK
jgi:hypothetical protein